MRVSALRESDDEDFNVAEVRRRKSVLAEQAKSRRKTIFFAGILLLLVGAVVGIAVGVSSSKGGDSFPSQSEAEKAPSPSPAAPVPSFVTSCQGFEYINPVISNLSASAFARYSDLLENLVQTLIPGYSEPENASCEPIHLALVWLANDDSIFSQIALRNRFTLAVLFVGFRGYAWNENVLNAGNRWLGSYSYCQWHGVVCDEEGKIRELELIRTVVSKTSIPEEIGLLTDLRK
jgi:hypothetical protein